MPLFRPRRRRRIKCFPVAEAGRLGFNTLPERHRPIDVAKIRGTVDRCNTLTPTFLSKTERGRSARYRSVLRAMKQDIPLPPIEVYYLRRDYYVIDGHHRVAAAITLGVAYLDAIVHPVVLPDTTYENRLDNRRQLFAQRTGLQHVDLAAPEDYAQALAIIDAYAASCKGKGLTYQDAARDWYERVYRPFVRRIEAHGSLAYLPGETEGSVLLHLYDDVRHGVARTLDEALAQAEQHWMPWALPLMAPLRPMARTVGTVARSLPRRRSRRR